MGNVQRKAAAASNRELAVKLNHEGVSAEDIASRLGVSRQSVHTYMKQYLAEGARYPLGLTQEIVDELRANEREQIHWHMRNVAQRLAKLDPDPEEFADRCRAVEVVAKAADTYTRLSARLSELYGLNAPKSEVHSTTNNNLMISGGDEVQYLRDLARLKELQNRKCRATAV
jgi:predicted transcriptional regulator